MVGYSLEDLNSFGYITYLSLDVRMRADALVNICKSNPHLESLSFRSTEILGRLSDIVPHCCNLKKLEFVPKPDNDGTEYAPLAELSNLRVMTIFRAFENGSLLTFFEAITNWQRPEHQLLTMNFIEVLPHLSNVTIARMNSFSHLELGYQREDYIKLLISYDFWDISRDSSPLEQSLATITLIGAELKIDCKGLALSHCPTRDIDIRRLVSLLRTLNIQNFTLADYRYKAPISKLFASMIPDESYALKSVDIHLREIGQIETSELVKIKSITSLICKFLGWESVELLSALPNLETVRIHIKEEFEKTYSKALCSLLNTCSESGVITCQNWNIEFKKSENILGQNKRIKTMIIAGREKNSDVFEAFGYRDLITIEELDVSECTGITIKDILKVAEVQPITKLRISLTNTNDIESLSNITELKELTICDSEEGSLIKLFDQLATKTSPSLQYLEIKSENLSSEELVLISRIRSLKKFNLYESQQLEDCESLMELANSNIEELTLSLPEFSLQQLFSAFATKTSAKLQHLKFKGGLSRSVIMIEELEELSKIQSLRSLQGTCCCDDISHLRNFKHFVKLDLKLLSVTSEVLQCLANLENLESLALFFNEYKNYIQILLIDEYVNNNTENDYNDYNDYKYNDHIDDNDNDVDVQHVLNDLKNIKKLTLSVSIGVNLTNVYQAFGRKSVKLTHLTTTIRCVEELNEITRIKSLRNLNIFFSRIGKNMTSISELSELESLQITVVYWEIANIRDSILSFLKCCKNLDRLLINTCWVCDLYNIFQRDIHSILKSVRDPTHQGPLTVILNNEVIDRLYNLHRKENIEEILINKKRLLCFENAYLKVFTLDFHNW
ncbi:uncharacterized protein [Drosophila kikkawai]|uniref:Uncharacterized protein isoform X2 n=1 Tax=Drosophila kikkawai TaxID=30033 RepID=A0A6P4JH41_DROKI|nr:uncharacterized protein LOC108082857 [Drosophila kikkawai]